MNTTPDKPLRPAFFLYSATRFDLHCLMRASASSPDTWEHHIHELPEPTPCERFALCQRGLLVAMIALLERPDATCQVLEWHVRADLDATDRQHAHFLLARAFALSRNHRSLIEHLRPRNSSIPARAYLQQTLAGGSRDLSIDWRARAGASFETSTCTRSGRATIEVTWRLDR